MTKRTSQITETDSRRMFPLAWAWDDLRTIARYEFDPYAEVNDPARDAERAVLMREAASRLAKAAHNVIDIVDSGQIVTEEGKAWLAQK